MRKQSRSGKYIERKLRSGVRPSTLWNMGYPKPTVRYYWRKITKPEQFKEYIKKIQLLNKRRYQDLSTS